jgi:hypothetical protein
MCKQVGHAAKITALYFLHYHLYTGDHDGTVIVWSVSDGRGGLSGKRKRATKKEAAAAKRAGGGGEEGLKDSLRPPRGFVPSGECVLEVLDLP